MEYRCRKFFLLALSLLLVGSGCSAHMTMTTAVPTTTWTATTSAILTVLDAYDIGQDKVVWGYCYEAAPVQDRKNLFSDALTSALADPANVDKMFAVWIYLNTEMGDALNPYQYDTWRFQGMSLKELRDRKMEAARSCGAWKHQKWVEAYGPEEPGGMYFDKWSGLSEENIRIEAAWDAEYQAQWQSEHPGEIYPATLYDLANQARESGWAAALSDFTDSLIKRIGELGYAFASVPGNKSLYAACISGDQLKNLPVIDGVASYSVMFANEQNCSFDGIYIRGTVQHYTWSLGEILRWLDDREKIEIEVVLQGHIPGAMLLAFKTKYPEAYAAIAANWTRMKSEDPPPCPNPREVDEAGVLLEDFAGAFYRQKLDTFIQENHLPIMDIYLYSPGNDSEPPVFCMKADKALILFLMDNAGVARVSYLPPAINFSALGN